MLVRYAKCCNPLPGDDILGFITRGRGVTIHRRGCPKAFDTDPERRVEITWDSKARINRSVQLRVVTANSPASCERRPDVHGARHQHQRGKLPGERRRPSRQPVLVRVRGSAAAEGVMKAAAKVKGVVAVERA